MFGGIEICGRVVWNITSEDGRNHYYDHLNHWRVCYSNENTVIAPTPQEAEEYRQMLQQSSEGRQVGRRFKLYETRYDWRPRKTHENGNIGLQSPNGQLLLPPIFADVFIQFSAMKDLPQFLPVSDGEAWALATLEEQPVMMTDFIYRHILPERWETGGLYFVQHNSTGKWGVIKRHFPWLNKDRRRCSLNHDKRAVALKEILPPIADEIYEAELYTDCAPTLFWIAKSGDKIGVITSMDATDIIYDSFDGDDENMTISLFRNGRLEKKVTSF